MADPGQGFSRTITPMSYHCPGLHGKQSRQNIKRKTFRQFFKENKRLIIPLFQRRYCWTDKTVWDWFEDVVRGKRDHLGVHNTGNLIAKTSGQEEGLIIIDGQQRLTTTMILLAALKEEIMKIGKENLEKMNSQSRQMWVKCVRDIKSALFLDESEDEEVERSPFVDGEVFMPSRLLPSFCDRKSFFEMMCSPNLTMNETEEISYQFRAKEIFRSRIAQEISEKRLYTVDAQVEWFSEVIHQVLDLMGITFVEILNDINMAQVFLWLQENAQFGQGSLLLNPTPGIFFTAVDMVRNLLLSPTMNQSMEEQEKFYRQNWFEPVESNFSGHHQIERFNQMLSDFVVMKTQNIDHISATESTYIKAMNAFPTISTTEKQYFATYAKFSSLFEKEGNNIMEKLQVDGESSTETMEHSRKAMQKASVSISSEFAKFISSKKLDELKKSETWH